MVIQTEWSYYEWDGGTRMRRLSSYRAPHGPRSLPLRMFIQEDGEPICVLAAVKDENGWFEIDPDPHVELGELLEFTFAGDHPMPNFTGSLIQSLT